MQQQGIVTVEVDSRPYRGTYRVERGIITVSSSAGSKATQANDASAEQLARLLLRELAREGG